MIKEDYDIEVAKEYTILQERIEDLEKENAELKGINTHTLSQLNLDNCELITKLTKAKEIIKDFLLMAKVEHLKDRYETVDEAEQFIKDSEVEK